jgi:Mn-dependent DtxR family transcriptional regulator
MLGFSRPTVTVAASLLKRKDVIEYTRGMVHIVDVARLETEACECYRVIKNHLDNYTELDSGIVS